MEDWGMEGWVEEGKEEEVWWAVGKEGWRREGVADGELGNREAGWKGGGYEGGGKDGVQAGLNLDLFQMRLVMRTHRRVLRTPCLRIFATIRGSTL